MLELQIKFQCHVCGEPLIFGITNPFSTDGFETSQIVTIKPCQICLSKSEETGFIKGINSLRNSIFEISLNKEDK